MNYIPFFLKFIFKYDADTLLYIQNHFNERPNLIRIETIVRVQSWKAWFAHVYSHGNNYKEHHNILLYQILFYIGSIGLYMIDIG